MHTINQLIWTVFLRVRIVISLTGRLQVRAPGVSPAGHRVANAGHQRDPHRPPGAGQAGRAVRQWGRQITGLPVLLWGQSHCVSFISVSIESCSSCSNDLLTDTSKHSTRGKKKRSNSEHLEVSFILNLLSLGKKILTSTVSLILTQWIQIGFRIGKIWGWILR